MKPDNSIEMVISYLNDKTGKRFRPTGKNKTITRSLLKSHGPEVIKRVIDSKCTEWTGSDMEKYLQPQTLFRKSNFQKYLEALEPEANRKLTPRQIEHREYLKTPKWLAKRSAVIKRSGHHCEGCGVYLGEKGHVHHLTYDHWQDEFLFELLYICQSCHEKIHKEKK